MCQIFYFTRRDNVYRALAVNQAICRKRKDWTCLVLATWQLSPCTRPTSWNVLLKRVAFCRERAAFRSERNRAMTMICSRLRGPIKNQQQRRNRDLRHCEWCKRQARNINRLLAHTLSYTILLKYLKTTLDTDLKIILLIPAKLCRTLERQWQYCEKF